MQKNWYAVYTKPHCEKKVTSLLTKKKIENFSPTNYRIIRSPRGDKIIREPLFKAYVFVNVSVAEIAFLKKTGGVINILYWMREPAIIRCDEIEAIKKFTHDHRTIELARVPVNVHDVTRVSDDHVYSIEGDVFTIKNKILKISLPSLGYIMMVNTGEENIIRREVFYRTISWRKHSEIQQQ